MRLLEAAARGERPDVGHDGDGEAEASPRRDVTLVMSGHRVEDTAGAHDVMLIMFFMEDVDVATLKGN